jgi:hypothetical protein
VASSKETRMPVKYAFILLLGVMMGSFNNMLDTWLVYNHATAYYFFKKKKENHAICHERKSSSFFCGEKHTSYFNKS